jgi:hypothetical protein
MTRVKNKKKLHHRLIRQAHHFLIPHKGNDHKPLALRPVALRLYTFSIIGVKLFVTTFLFLTYPSIGHFASITEAEILSYTNASRAESGIPALSLNSKLNQAAQLKAQDMIADNYFAHTAPDGTKPWEFLKQAGYSYAAAGENLAMDFTEASSVHAAFMNSPSHLKNIVNEKYTEMGVAVLDGELQGHQTTILVEFFGQPYQAATAVEPTPPQPSTPPATQPNTNTTVNTNTNTGQQPPTPTPPPTTTPTLPKPYYQAELSDQSAEELGIKPLEQIGFWVEFKNTGNTTWTKDGQYYVALNVTNPAGRHSEFEDESWVEYYRPAKLSQDSVKPGQTGRFEFTLKAPEEAGAYEESFGLVAENLTWISGGTIELPIVVVAPPEQSTETQVEIIPTPLTTNTNQEPTNTNQTSTNINTNTNTSEQALAGNEEKIIVKAENIGEQQDGFVGKILEYSERFYLVMLIFVVVALLINIVVKIRIQHPHVIVQSVLVIIIITSALFLDTHFLESVPKILKII